MQLYALGKRQLVGKTWSEVAESVWQSAGQMVDTFLRRDHVAYAQLVAVHMNILEEQNGRKKQKRMEEIQQSLIRTYTNELQMMKTLCIWQQCCSNTVWSPL